MHQSQNILISGKMGSGKTTTAERLIATLSKKPATAIHHFTFSTPLYHIHDYILSYLQPYIKEPLPKKHGPLLQLLGTEFGRNQIHPNIWVDITRANIDKFHVEAKRMSLNSIAIVSDCRFKNEFEAFPEAYKVRLEAPRDVRKERCHSWRENETHPSEIDLDEYVTLFDLVLDTAKLTPMQCAAEIIWDMSND